MTEVSVFEERAAEALRTTQAIAKTVTQELARLGRLSARVDPSKHTRLYHEAMQALMSEHLKLARQAVRTARESTE